MVNIFEVIAGTTRQTEPFHSRYLAAELVASLQGDRSFFDAFWALATNADVAWPTPTSAEIVTEDLMADWQRVDVVLLAPSRLQPRFVLGVEVKIRDASASMGQLQGYADRLNAKYPTASVRLAYLTPFTRVSQPDHADRLHSVREVESFRGAVEHIAWTQISELPHTGGALWAQHRAFVGNRVSSPASLARASIVRGLADFFGDDSISEFTAALECAGADLVVDVRKPRRALIHLDKVRDRAALCEAFRALITSPNCGTATKKDTFPSNLRARFLSSKYGPVHELLFSLTTEYPQVFVRGQNDYGLCVAHNRHGEVSLCSSAGPDLLAVTIQR